MSNLKNWICIIIVPIIVIVLLYLGIDTPLMDYAGNFANVLVSILKTDSGKIEFKLMILLAWEVYLFFYTIVLLILYFLIKSHCFRKGTIITILIIFLFQLYIIIYLYK